MRRSRFTFLRVFVAVLLALVLAGSPAFATGKGTSTVLVYVRISGGWQISRLMKSRPGSPYSLCTITTYVQAGGKQRGRPLYSVYTVQFEKRPQRTYHRQFGLTVLDYRAGQPLYSRPAGTLIDVSVHFHTYFGAPTTDSAYRITVRIGRNGLSGTFLAQHVGTTNLISRWPHVTLQGWWTCLSLQRRSIPVL